MGTDVIQTSFGSGEISPSLWGRVDLAKWAAGCGTLRNFVVNYRGGAMSRGGTKWVGISKQPGTSYPPRIVPFHFSVTQGIVLEFGERYMRVIVRGAYVTEATKAVTGASNGNPGAITVPSHGWSNGDMVFLTGLGGITELNGRMYLIDNVTPDTFTLNTVLGLAVNSLAYGAYTSGGTAARVYTLTTPYAAADLDYLKFTQSADVMSLTCVNIVTQTEYPPYDLARFADNNWTLTQTTFAASIAAPANPVLTTSTAGGTGYKMVVTAIDRDTGDESVASVPASVASAGQSSAFVAQLTLTWSAVVRARMYNIYKAPPGFAGTASIPIGSLFGYVGSSFGTQFVDNFGTPDLTLIPPRHINPFARGEVLEITMTAGGAGYAQATTTVSITSASGGTGAVLTPIVIAGAVVAVIVESGGENYTTGDTVVIAGAGAGATATATIGPRTGTYPGCPAYFQQRRVYAASLNEPDTYHMSQPGSFINFDSSDLPIASDAIEGNPWAQQVNGIQFMQPMPGGLVCFTGLDVWQIAGGANNAPITPTSQQANAQAHNGCSATVPPIPINEHILYVQAKGSIIRDITYNFVANIYTGVDLTILSNHLFDGFQIKQWAYAEEPYKIIWHVRNDGTMLSLTYLKEQEIVAWARHDTNGVIKSVCAVSEPPVDATYLVVKRYVNGAWRYFIERMDDRIWQAVEETWCVDAGLAYGQDAPAAELTIAAVSGSAVAFVASDGVFTAADVGKIIRAGGGKAVVAAFVSPTQVTCNITDDIAFTIPNDPDEMPLPVPAGGWTMAATTTIVRGLDHLEGKTVSILADGSVVTSRAVTNGQVTLDVAASQILIGLGFTAQLQSLYSNIPGEGTVQGKRKLINSCTVRVRNSRGLKVGVNQADVSTQPNYAPVQWINVVEIKQRGALISAGEAIPLFTGDQYINVGGTWEKPGQVAVEQSYPLPAEVVAFIPEVVVGDSNG